MLLCAVGCAGSPAVGRGGYRPLAVGGSGDVIAWERRHGDERVVVVANLAGAGVERVSVALPLDGGGSLQRLFGTAEASLGAAGELEVAALGARELVAYRVEVP